MYFEFDIHRIANDPRVNIFSLSPTNLMIIQLWISKNIGYDEILSIKVLNG